MKNVAVSLMLIVLAGALAGCALCPDDIVGRWSCVSEGELVQVYITTEHITQQIGSSSQVWRYTLDRGSMQLYSPFSKETLYISCVKHGESLILDGLYFHRED